jgi:shikimate kinase
MRVLLYGMKHCGKSTLGQALSRYWDCPFYDVDELIENAFKAEECRSMTVREILAHYGENGFSKREERTVVDLYERIRDCDAEKLRSGELISDYVIALGGRTPLNPRLQSILKKMGLNIFLKINAEEAWQRVARSGIPSFLKSSNPKQEFLSLYREREPHYRRQADLVIPLGGLTEQQSLKKIVDALKEKGYARQ